MKMLHANFEPGDEMRVFQALISRPSQEPYSRSAKAHSIEDFAQRLLSQSRTRTIARRDITTGTALVWDVAWFEVVRPTEALRKNGTWHRASAIVTEVDQGKGPIAGCGAAGCAR